MEDNKLIAEFMGYKVGKLNGWVSGSVGECMYKKDEEGELHDITKLDKSQYHTSWDWLMPVVKKLKEKNTNPNRTIDAKNHGLLNIALMQADIDSIYKQVVTIIKNHNQLNP